MTGRERRPDSLTHSLRVTKSGTKKKGRQGGLRGIRTSKRPKKAQLTESSVQTTSAHEKRAEKPPEGGAKPDGTKLAAIDPKTKTGKNEKNNEKTPTAKSYKKGREKKKKKKKEKDITRGKGAQGRGGALIPKPPGQSQNPGRLGGNQI